MTYYVELIRIPTFLFQHMGLVLIINVSSMHRLNYRYHSAGSGSLSSKVSSLLWSSGHKFCSSLFVDKCFTIGLQNEKLAQKYKGNAIL